MASPGGAETLRIATYHTSLSRDGPGLLLRDILRGDDPQITAVTQVITEVAADVLLLQDIDYDLGLTTLTALRDQLSAQGMVYPYMFAFRPNSGMATGVDLDGDGKSGRPGDAQGYGTYSGQGGMAILSRFPIDHEKARDFSTLLWQDMPGALISTVDGAPFPSDQAIAVQRLSDVGHWVVPVQMKGGALFLLAFHAGPPVFDGPEDRNGRRNHDEIRFWQHFLDGAFGTAPDKRFVVLGDANLDPHDSDGRHAAIRSLLNDPRLQDTMPTRPGPAPAEPGHKGDPRLDTATWPTPGPGNLRVDYVLPSVDLTVVQAGVHWPAENTPEGQAATLASRHRMVWVDLIID